MPEPDWPRATYGLTDVYFSDPEHGWATGYDNIKNESVVLRTSNGGRLWKTARPSGGGAYAANALTATAGGRLWVAGSEGWDGALISRSADKGATWGYVSVPTLEYLLGIQAVTGKVGYAAGTGGALLRTADGGATWKEVATAPQGDLLGMHFASATDGWALANDRTTMTGTVEHTTDGGATWTAQTSVPGTLLYAIDAVGQDVWVAGGNPSAGPVVSGERPGVDGVLLHSADGGATWHRQWGGGAGDPRVSDVDMVDDDVGLGGRRRERLAAGARPPHHRRRRHLDRAGSRRRDLPPRRRPRTRRPDRVGRRRRAADPAHHRRRSHLELDPRRRRRAGHARVSGYSRSGSRVSMQYVVDDDWSSRVRVTIRISDGYGHLVKSRALGWQHAGPSAHRFAFLCDLPPGTYYVKAFATDRAGNPQRRMAAAGLWVL